MVHILIECQVVGRGTIWELLEELWTSAGYEWKEPSLGTILGVGCAVIESETGEHDSVKEALWLTLWSELAYLI